MKSQGVFTDQELEAARAKLNAMSDSEFKTLSSSAQKASQDPVYLKKAQEIFVKPNTEKGTSDSK